MSRAIRQYGGMFGGNPVGNNPEITSQLSGNNPKHISFINAEAGMRINENGELIDPWGTPYFSTSFQERTWKSTAPDPIVSCGRWMIWLSNSWHGSRGTGAAMCDHNSKIDFSQFPDLPSELKRLAWLSLDSQERQEYWNAMELMGQYAAANHACIHRHIAENLGAQVLLDLENHHNFAWKERHVIDGVEREVVVHRKGATPAGAGVLGVIPGSMASPGFVVSGKGNAESLELSVARRRAEQ